MKTNDALLYVIGEAQQLGYTNSQIAAFSFEIRERLSEMETTDKDDLDKLVEELF